MIFPHGQEGRIVKNLRDQIRALMLEVVEMVLPDHQANVILTGLRVLLASVEDVKWNLR